MSFRVYPDNIRAKSRNSPDELNVNGRPTMSLGGRGMQVSCLGRRDFLTGAGAAAWSAVSARRVYGANDRLRVGLIGCGERGTFDARLMRGTPEDIQAVAPENYHDGNLDPRLKEPRNVEIVALCDVLRRPDGRGQEMGAAGQDLRRFPQAARRQGSRRGHHRHPGPLARADADPGLRGRQGRLPARSRCSTGWARPRP